MVTSPRERILEATFACVGRYGLGKTTVEDVAREAGVSRATVYRQFPGGREELIRDVIGWEMGRFFTRLAEEVAASGDLHRMIEDALVFARRSLVDHQVLNKVLETEPDRLLPTLTVESDRVLHLIAVFLQPHLERAELRPGVEAAEAADYIGRLFLSLLASPGRWDLGDRGQVAEVVRTEILSGVLADR
jgi:AcrR family transcriptional regulator